MASPLLGYNTNVRHSGKLYHIQTEDSGATHGHIFTHLFADGGRIIASKKTTYAHWIGTDKYPEVVKKLMQQSHKAMFIALRDGRFDGDEAAGARFVADLQVTLDEASAEAPARAVPPSRSEPAQPAAQPAAKPAPPEPEVDVDALERAAAARLAQAQAQQAPLPSARYGSTRPAVTPQPVPRPSRKPDPTSESIFGSDLLSEKSLDEVILSYLAEDMDDEG